MFSETGFFLHHSHQLPVLATALGHSLLADDGRDWLQADTVLIPQTSLKRWLQNTLGEQLGITANLQFEPPGAFIDRMLAPWRLKAGNQPVLDEHSLHWRLFGLLQNTDLLARPAFAPVSAYLNTDNRQLHAWQLAGELGVVFEKYQAWRRPWLLAWNKQPPSDDWQAQLWHQASKGASFRAQTLQAFLHEAQRPDCRKPPDLPARINIFACQNLSPDVLRVLQAFGRWCRVEFFLHNPCEAYWGDVRAPQNADDLLALREDNPLLNQWGYAGRDFVASILSDQSVEWAGEAGHYPEPEAEPVNILQRLQADILNRCAPEPLWPNAAAIAADDSLQIHNCASPLREVQMLRAQLLARLQADPSLNWRDIAVMAPDLERYAPYFGAVFGNTDDAYPALPFALSDRSLYPQSGLADVFFRLLALGRSRFTSNEGFELLSHPMVAAYYKLDADDLQHMHVWLLQAQVRWGFDDKHRGAVDGQAQQAFTWRDGLKRLLYGYASDDALVAETAPANLPSGQQRRLLDCLCRFIDTLDQFRRALCCEVPAADWQTILTDLLNAFCGNSQYLPELDRETHQRLNQRIAALSTLATEAGMHEPLGLAMIESYMADEGEATLSQAWLAGRITVCKMVPMRLIPFKVIALLGLDEAAFPRNEPESALDKLASPGTVRQLGDRRVRDDDRFLLLQTLCACQGHLILSYVGTDPVTGNALLPSLLVRELIDTLGRYAADGQAQGEPFIIQHPIHDFEPSADSRRAVLGQTPHGLVETAALGLFAPVMTEAPDPLQAGEVDIEAFIRFWQKPLEVLARVHGIHHPKQQVLLPENEPYGVASGLSKYQLVEALLAEHAQHADDTSATLCRQLQAHGLLPTGAAGASRLQPIWQSVAGALAELTRERMPAKHWPIDLPIGPVRLSGVLQQHFAPGLITLALHSEKPQARDWIEAGIHTLIASAAGLALPACIYTDRLLTPLASIDSEVATQRLQLLLAYYQAGQQRIVCFDAKHSLKWWQAQQKDAGLTVDAWLQQQLAQDDDSSRDSDNPDVQFLSYGTGFLQAIAAPNPDAFAHTSAAVYKALLGEPL